MSEQGAMKMEGVTICVGFADLLAETLPLNVRHFDRLVVVTAPEDVETQRVCRYYSVPHIQTDVFRSRWGEMHKAKGINLGLQQLDLDGWVAHLDADVVLPPTTRALLKRAGLNDGMLYGCHRYDVPGFDAWRAHQAMPPLQQDGYHVNMQVFPLSPAFAGERMGGYAPPGFFQLWHPGGSGVGEYPANHSSASRTDVMFASRWWRAGRALLPEFVAYHLMPEPATNGTNWDGRRTKRWGPQPDERSPFHPRNHRPPPGRQDWRTLDSPPPEQQHPRGHRPENVLPPTIQTPPSYDVLPRVGDELRALPGEWRGDPTHFRYQWEYCERREFVRIPEARHRHYEVRRRDVGKRLRVQVLAHNRFGEAEASSECTGPVEPRLDC